MATLAEAVDAAETDWVVSADITADYLTVESETVAVLAHFPAQYQATDGSTSAPRIRVARGAGGTTAASHADGTTLTPLVPPASSGGGGGAIAVTDGTTTVEAATSIEVTGGTVTDEGGGVAGVAITNRLIGPFRFNFDETDNFKALADLDEGAVVVEAWPEMLTAFNNGGATVPTFEIYVGPIAGDWLLLSQSGVDGTANTRLDAAAAADVSGTTVGHLKANSRRPARIKTAGNSLIGSLNIGDAQPTTGALDVYALIAEPAA